MAKQKISKEKSIRRTKRLTEFVVVAVLVTAGALIVKGAVGRSNKISNTNPQSSTEITVADATEATTEAFDPNKLIFENENVDTKEKFKGELILVNNQHQYFSDGKEDLVSILEMNDQKGITCFGSVDYSYTILRPAYEAMAKMICDFYDKYQLDNIIIYGSYRTTDFQRELYEADLASNGTDNSTRVAKPGFSEHESGYAFDFTTTPDYDFQGTGDYAWFSENCWKYGYILRYPQNKEHKTEIQFEPWHFRYCGIPHAYYMSKNGLCMEEYIEKLEKEFPYSGQHLEFTDDNGQAYEVYFVPSEDGSDTTSVPVPSGLKYEISGNNYSGFIVTVYKDKSGAAQEKTTESQPETSTETTTISAAE